MVNLRRNHLPVHNDSRKNPRIEFHLPISIMGMNVRSCILDFSLGGFYIEVDCTDYFSAGQTLRLGLRFPGESDISMIKVSIVRIEKQGIGCKFIDLDPVTYELLKGNFEIFSCTLPIYEDI
jgi:hypothetical protein